MRKMPWVRFFASDWLAGTRGMSAVETGVYITLIATMYERGEPIQEDHARLARLCGASNSAFKKALETLVDEGKITRTENGLWNDRVEKEQVYLSEKSEVGSKAATARWGKKDNENNDGDHANALHPQSDGNANQKPDARSQIEEKKEPTGSSKKGTRLPADWQPDIEFAVSVGLSQAQARNEADKFREWWPAQPGQKGVKLDWGLTWKTWCRKVGERLPRGQAPPKMTHHQQRHHDALKAADEFIGINRDEPEFAGSTFDLDPGDFRSH